MTGAEKEAQDRRVRQKAGFLTGGIFLVVAVLCYLLTAYTLSDPPPGTQYVAIGMADIGNSLTATGDTESDFPSESVEEAVQPTEAASPSQQQAASQVVTQARSEVSANNQPNPNNGQGQQSGPRVSTSLNNRLGALRSGGGGSQGSGETGTGNEGIENGEPFRTGADGNAAWGLQGGDMIGYPQLDEKPTKAGYIRLKVRVNKAGQVTGVDYDPLESSLADSRSIALAKRAALTARFSTSSTMPIRNGYIVIRFELK